MPDEDGLVDPRLGKRLIAETRLLRNELRIERAIFRALKIHEDRALMTIRRVALSAAVVPPDPFDLAFWDTSVVKEVQPVVESVLDGIAAGVTEFLALPPEVRSQILGSLDVAGIAEHFIDVVKTIGPSTAERVVEQLAMGTGRGESIPELAQRVTQSFGVARSNATRIVRTETHGAAELTTFKSVGAVADAGFSIEKKWLDTSDARTRKTHKTAGNGDWIPMDQPFSVGVALLEYPGAHGPAHEVINCRCSVEYRVSDHASVPPTRTPPVPDATPVQALATESAVKQTWNDLTEKVRYSEKRAKELRKRLTDEGYGDFVETIKAWQYGGTDKIHRQLKSALGGGKMSTEAREIIQGIRAAPQSAPQLFRGTFAPKGVDTLQKEYVNGETFDLAPKSFSTEAPIGLIFAGQQQGTKAGTKILYQLTSKSKGIPVQNLSETRALFSEKEWISGGRYKILDSYTIPDPEFSKKKVLVIQIEQIAVH